MSFAIYIDWGAQVYLAGTVGEDQEAQALKEAFVNLGLRPEQIGLQSIRGRPTTQKTPYPGR